MSNPIQYTSRTFATVMADINADPTLADKPDWFKRLIAGGIDILSVIENASANQAFLRTAFSKKAVDDIANMLDYYPGGRTEASGTLMFDILASASPPFTIAQGNLVATAPGSIGAAQRRYEARAQLNVVASSETVASTAVVVADDKITVANVYTTGEKVRLTFTATLPTSTPQVAIDTDYFAIYVDATHIRLATSRVNAFTGAYIDFTAQGTGNHTIVRLSRGTTAYHQTTVAQYLLAASDGSAWQEIRIAQVGVLKATLVVTISSIAWSQVDTLVNSLATDKHYRVLTNTDGTTSIRFGDGTMGAIPPNGTAIYVAYAHGGGLASNVALGNTVTSYAGSDANVTGVFNPAAMAGGGDGETIALTKILAPQLLKSRGSFIVAEDGEALALAFGGISQAKVVPNAYGVMSAAVIGVASGSQAALSVGVRTALQAYLISKTILDSVDVRVEAGTFTSAAVAANVHLAAGYSWATVSGYVALALRLTLSAAGREIAAAFKSSGGVESAVTLINAVFGTAFSAADYQQISVMLATLDQIGPRQFGDRIDLSDVLALAGLVYGVDYITITNILGTATPSAAWFYQGTSLEILVAGTMTLTEV